jgi:dTDP-4-dehydrorhamnose 3,5-epimerase
MEPGPDLWHDPSVLQIKEWDLLMRLEQTQIADLWAVRLEWQDDARGSFTRLFCHDEFSLKGITGMFVQTSLSVSRQLGTLRGMHMQRAPFAETKLVSCVRGAIYDVVVDMRHDSPTYLRWQAFELSQAGDLALCIPKGCLHGFQTLADDCGVLYQMDAPYSSIHADGVRYDDPALNIEWPVEVTVISERDLNWPQLNIERSGGR